MNLESAGESFDFVFTHYVTWTLSDSQKAYAGMVRVLKKGGRLVNADADYGRTFRRMDAEGLTKKLAKQEPSRYAHPYQSLEMLRERNRLAESLYIADAGRPAWDVKVLLDPGVSRIGILKDVEEEYFGKKRQDGQFYEGQFLIAAVK